MSDVKQPDEYQRAVAVSRYVQLQNVSLDRIDASLVGSREDVLESAPWELIIKDATAHSFNEATKDLRIQVAFVVTMKPAEGEQKRDLIRMACGFSLSYAFVVDGGPEGDERTQYFDAFARLNAVHNAWPYFRELIQSTGARMGLPPIVIPVHRVKSAGKERESKAASSAADASTVGAARLVRG